MRLLHCNCETTRSLHGCLVTHDSGLNGLVNPWGTITEESVTSKTAMCACGVAVIIYHSNFFYPLHTFSAWTFQCVST